MPLVKGREGLRLSPLDDESEERMSMRIAIVLVGLAAALAFAGSAAAEPEPPPANCIPFFDMVVCFEGRGVARDTFTPSGNYTFIDHSNITYTITHVPTGVVTQTTSTNQTYGDLLRDGELQVHHFVATFVGSSIYEGGVTCRGIFQEVWANGEVRHELSKVRCS